MDGVAGVENDVVIAGGADEGTDLNGVEVEVGGVASVERDAELHVGGDVGVVGVEAILEVAEDHGRLGGC